MTEHTQENIKSGDETAKTTASPMVDAGAVASDPAPAADAATARQPGHEERIAALDGELAAARQEILYAQAETQNVRRRLEREVKDAHAYAATRFARDILSVADNLQRALEAIPAELRAGESGKALVTGLEATAREIEAVFQRNGVTRFTAIGEKLDPNRHQAMIEMPSDKEPGTIVQEMQPGYMIGDRLLRPAMVGVARAG